MGVTGRALRTKQKYKHIMKQDIYVYHYFSQIVYFSTMAHSEFSKDQFLLDLGVRVAFLRNEKGFTQEDLAFKMEVETKTISRIENGRTNPTSITLKKIALALEVSLEELVRGL